MKMLTKIWNMETGWMNKWPGIPEKSKTQMSGGGVGWDGSRVRCRNGSWKSTTCKIIPSAESQKE